MKSSLCRNALPLKFVTGLICCSLAISALGCQAKPATAVPTANPTVQQGDAPIPSEPPQTIPPVATAQPVPTAILATATPAPVRVGTLDAVPQAVLTWVTQHLGVPIEILTSGDTDLRIQSSDNPLGSLVWEEILVPVTAFNSPRRTLDMDDLEHAWTADGAETTIARIYVDAAHVEALTQVLGAPGSSVEALPTENIVNALWQDESAIGVVPFESMNVRLEALRIGGNSPLDNRFDAAAWPLAVRYWLAPENAVGLDVLTSTGPLEVWSNRDPQKLTVLVATGVTAMARGTAAAIEDAGDYAFPARQIGPELAAADLTLISNEIPFVQDCEVDNTLNNLLLCSKFEYFDALAESGVDAVGLSGNHQNDFGYEADLASLELYAEKGIPTYGGGANDEQAWATLSLEDHGNRLTFVGANQYGPEAYWSGVGEEVSAWAGEDNPGSARFSLDRMRSAIAEAKQSTDLVLAEVQHTEFNWEGDYQTEPLDEQIVDFEAMSDAGATIVTGVQAHAPQGVELRGDGIILYGLGNLYFDQTWSWETRTGLIARHTIYDHRLIHTELLVSVIQDDLQLRWATDAERDEVLASVFAASRW